MTNGSDTHHLLAHGLHPPLLTSGAVVIRVCSCIAFGGVAGVTLLAISAAVATHFADLNLFQEKDTPCRSSC